MAYNERLAPRVREALANSRGVVEKRVFGGVAFLLHGNMLVGVHKDDFAVRIDRGDTGEVNSDADSISFALLPRMWFGKRATAPKIWVPLNVAEPALSGGAGN